MAGQLLSTVAEDLFHIHTPSSRMPLRASHKRVERQGSNVAGQIDRFGHNSTANERSGDDDYEHDRQRAECRGSRRAQMPFDTRLE